MSKSYEYDITLCTGPGDTYTETIEDVTGFVDDGSCTTFHKAGEVVARFRNVFVVGIVRGDEADADPKRDAAA